MTKAIKQFAAAAIFFTFIPSVPVSIFAQKKNGKGSAAAPTFGNVNAITGQQMKQT